MLEAESDFRSRMNRTEALANLSRFKELEGLEEIVNHDDQLIFAEGLRNQFTILAKGYLHHGKRDSAFAVMDLCEEVLPHQMVPYDYVATSMIGFYLESDAPQKASHILDRLIHDINQGRTTYNPLFEQQLFRLFEQYNAQFIPRSLEKLKR